jgi:hypothetical protein
MGERKPSNFDFGVKCGLLEVDDSFSPKGHNMNNTIPIPQDWIDRNIRPRLDDKTPLTDVGAFFAAWVKVCKEWRTAPPDHDLEAIWTAGLSDLGEQLAKKTTPISVDSIRWAMKHERDFANLQTTTLTITDSRTRRRAKALGLENGGAVYATPCGTKPYNEEDGVGFPVWDGTPHDLDGLAQVYFHSNETIGPEYLGTAEDHWETLEDIKARFSYYATDEKDRLLIWHIFDLLEWHGEVRLVDLERDLGWPHATVAYRLSRLRKMTDWRPNSDRQPPPAIGRECRPARYDELGDQIVRGGGTRPKPKTVLCP